jgi:hypothetical protein
MDRVTVRSYRIVDQVPEQARQRLFRRGPFAERTQCYTAPAKIKISSDPGGTKRGRAEKRAISSSAHYRRRAIEYS